MNEWSARDELADKPGSVSFIHATPYLAAPSRSARAAAARNPGCRVIPSGP